MKKSLGIILSVVLLLSSLLTCLFLLASAEAKSVTLEDFDGETHTASMTYPTPDSADYTEPETVTDEGLAFEGKSLKILLQYVSPDTKFTYKVGTDATFPADAEKLYVSFWMKSDVDCVFKIQIPDLNWNGDKYYLVEVQQGTHMYNIDITDCGFQGTRGIMINNWGEYFETAPEPFSGNAYLDSVIITDTPRTLPGDDTSSEESDVSDVTSDVTSDTSKPTSSADGILITDFEEGQLTPKPGAYMVEGKHFDLVTDPVYSGSRSLKLNLNYEGSWTNHQWVLEPATHEDWFRFEDDTRYLSFWMSSDVDCVLRVNLLGEDWKDYSYPLEVKKGTRFYNIPLTEYHYSLPTIRGVMFNLNADDYEDWDSDEEAPTWQGTAYVDSIRLTAEPREETFPSEDTSDASGTSSAQDIPSTGVEMMILPLALLAVGSGAILVIRKKK